VEGLSLDAGALIAAERDDRPMWAFMKAVRADGVVPQVPAGALAQAWRGGVRSARLAQFLVDCAIVPLDDELAKHSGELLANSRSVDAVDASVVVTAARVGGVVVTSDPVDLLRLAAHVKGVRILDLRELGKPKK